MVKQLNADQLAAEALELPCVNGRITYPTWLGFYEKHRTKIAATFILVIIGADFDKKADFEDLEAQLIEELTGNEDSEEDVPSDNISESEHDGDYVGPESSSDEDIPNETTMKENKRIREEQDLEFEESLKIDEKKRKTQEEEEVRQKEAREREINKELENAKALDAMNAMPVDIKRNLIADRFERLQKEKK